MSGSILNVNNTLVLDAFATAFGLRLNILKTWLAGVVAWYGDAGNDVEFGFKVNVFSAAADLALIDWDFSTRHIFCVVVHTDTLWYTGIGWAAFTTLNCHYWFESQFTSGVI